MKTGNKKLILMSDNSITKKPIKDELKKLIGYSLKDKKVLLVFTLRREKDRTFLNFVIDNLIELGISKKNIINLNISKDISLDKLEGFDFIYFCGGNTFYILDRLKKTGFDKFLKKCINNGKVYVGVSAGAIILTKDISIASVGEDPDENEIGLKDLSGLNIIDFDVFPHYQESEEESIKNFEKNSGRKVKRLKDGEILKVN